MKPFARINLSSVAPRRGILVSSLALMAAMVCGCMGNYAYYLEKAGRYNSWEELRNAAFQKMTIQVVDSGAGMEPLGASPTRLDILSGCK